MQPLCLSTSSYSPIKTALNHFHSTTELYLKLIWLSCLFLIAQLDVLSPSLPSPRLRFFLVLEPSFLNRCHARVCTCVCVCARMWAHIDYGVVEMYKFWTTDNLGLIVIWEDTAAPTQVKLAPFLTVHWHMRHPADGKSQSGTRQLC